MALNNLDLAALVSSRICHDLISPIGAINNGLELLNMSGLAHDGPEIQLIGDSVKVPVLGFVFSELLWCRFW